MALGDKIELEVGKEEEIRELYFKCRCWRGKNDQNIFSAIF